MIKSGKIFSSYLEPQYRPQTAILSHLPPISPHADHKKVFITVLIIHKILYQSFVKGAGKTSWNGKTEPEGVTRKRMVIR